MFLKQYQTNLTDEERADIATWEEEERTYWEANEQEYREPDDSALADWYDEDHYTGTDY